MSNNLGWTTQNATDSNKAGIINDDQELFDAAVTEVLTLATDTSPTLTTTELKENYCFEFPSTNTFQQSLVIPSGVKKLFAVVNNCATQPMRVAKGATEFYLAPETGELFYAGTGATDLTMLGPLNSQSNRYLALQVFASGTYTSSEVLASYVFTKDYTAPVGLDGSVFRANVAPSDGAASLSIRKNGVEIGTIDFADGETDATFTFSTETSFTTDDVLTVLAPGTADTSLSGVFGVLEFTEVTPEDAGPGDPPLNFYSIGSVSFVRPGPMSFASVGSVAFVKPGPMSFATVGTVTFVKPS